MLTICHNSHTAKSESIEAETLTPDEGVEDGLSLVCGAPCDRATSVGSSTEETAKRVGGMMVPEVISLASGQEHNGLTG